MKTKRQKARISIEVECELEGSSSAKQLLMKGTSFVFEPIGMFGCVISHSIVSVREIKEKDNDIKSNAKSKKNTAGSGSSGAIQQDLFAGITSSCFEPASVLTELQDSGTGTDIVRKRPRDREVAPGTRGGKEIKIGIRKPGEDVGRRFQGSYFYSGED